jgi:hypothetical protein
MTTRARKEAGPDPNFRIVAGDMIRIENQFRGSSGDQHHYVTAPAPSKAIGSLLSPLPRRNVTVWT